MKLNLNYLESSLGKLNICLSDEQKNAFSDYYDFMIHENSKKNLTRIVDDKEVVLKHYIDSIFISKYIDIANNRDLKIVDIGAGAGFPSIPLKICFPDVDILMIDSVKKKVDFLNDVIDLLHLEKAEAICGRAEDILSINGFEVGSDSEDDFKLDEERRFFRERFDFCVSRAVANLSTLSEYCIPFVKVGGEFIAYKSDSDSDEIKNAENAISVLGGRIKKIEDFVLPDTDEKRCFVFIEKISETEKKYPRRAGIPLKRPL